MRRGVQIDEEEASSRMRFSKHSIKLMKAIGETEKRAMYLAPVSLIPMMTSEAAAMFWSSGREREQ